MAVIDAVLVAVIGVFIIEGIWLAVLTYLLWRRSKTAKGSPPVSETADESKPA